MITIVLRSTSLADTRCICVLVCTSCLKTRAQSTQIFSMCASALRREVQKTWSFRSKWLKATRCSVTRSGFLAPSTSLSPSQWKYKTTSKIVQEDCSRKLLRASRRRRVPPVKPAVPFRSSPQIYSLTRDPSPPESSGKRVGDISPRTRRGFAYPLSS